MATEGHREIEDRRGVKYHILVKIKEIINISVALCLNSAALCGQNKFEYETQPQQSNSIQLKYSYPGFPFQQKVNPVYVALELLNKQVAFS